VKPRRDSCSIAHLKTHAASLIEDVAEDRRTIVITQHGVARAVLLDVETYEGWTKALMLLRLIAHGQADVEAGRLVPQDEAFRRAGAQLTPASGAVTCSMSWMACRR
jgi:prevent-host-death family protein